MQVFFLLPPNNQDLEEVATTLGPVLGPQKEACWWVQGMWVSKYPLWEKMHGGVMLGAPEGSSAWKPHCVGPLFLSQDVGSSVARWVSEVPQQEGENQTADTPKPALRPPRQQLDSQQPHGDPGRDPGWGASFEVAGD